MRQLSERSHRRGEVLRAWEAARTYLEDRQDYCRRHFALIRKKCNFPKNKR